MPRIFMTGRQRALLAQCWYGQSDPLYAVVSRCVADAGGEFAMGSTEANADELSAVLACAGPLGGEWSDSDLQELTPLFVSIDVFLFPGNGPRFDRDPPPLESLVDGYESWLEFGGVEEVNT